jgi:hypothetical protein
VVACARNAAHLGALSGLPVRHVQSRPRCVVIAAREHRRWHGRRAGHGLRLRAA